MMRNAWREARQDVLLVGFDFQQSVRPGQRGRLQVAAGKGEPLHDAAELRWVVRKPCAGSVVFARKINQDRLGAVENEIAPSVMIGSAPSGLSLR